MPVSRVSWLTWPRPDVQVLPWDCAGLESAVQRVGSERKEVVPEYV